MTDTITKKVTVTIKDPAKYSEAKLVAAIKTKFDDVKVLPAAAPK